MKLDDVVEFVVGCPVEISGYLFDFAGGSIERVGYFVE